MEKRYDASELEMIRARHINRRLARTDADDEGRWITTENGHKVHLNEEGEPDKGNPHVIEKMTGEAKPEPKKKYSVHNPYKSVYAKSGKDGKSDFSPETVRDIQHPGFSRAEQNDLIDDCIAYVMDHPEKYFETKDALRGGLAERLEWELGHDNIGWLDETFKPWLESEKKKLKDQIPPPKKNQSTSMELNGEKITFRNERNAGTDAKQHPRFIDVVITDPKTGDRKGSYAALDYESAMEHIYRMAGLRTKSWN